MKCLLLTFFLCMNAYAEHIYFDISVKAQLTSDVTYVENGKRVTVSGFPHETGWGILINCLEKKQGFMGRFNKNQSTPLRMALNSMKDLHKKPMAFKGLQKKGCPKTSEYFVRPEVELWISRSSGNLIFEGKCSDIGSLYTVEECMSSLDEVDDKYTSDPKEPAVNQGNRIVTDKKRKTHFVQAKKASGKGQ